jgi:hypothetical protein
MKVRVTSTIILDDNHWGFTDLIEGRLICQEVMDEIKDLIMEDSYVSGKRSRSYVKKDFFLFQLRKILKMNPPH